MRKRATKAEIEMLDRQILDVLARDNPQSVRHVFYRMTDPRLPLPVDKTESGYQRVQRRCLELRRAGVLPYGHIVDATRRGYHVATFDGAGDFIERMAALYRANLWTVDDPLIEIWTESRSIAAVVQGECERLAVSLYPAGGFASATLCFEAAQEIDRQDRPEAVVLYIGDYDPAGVLIDRAIEAELRAHLRTPLTVHRIAINPEQIESYDLPAKPRKATDRRRPDLTQTVEAEAMPAEDMRTLVRVWVENFIDRDALDVAQAAEQSEREGLLALGRSLN